LFTLADGRYDETHDSYFYINTRGGGQAQWEQYVPLQALTNLSPADTHSNTTEEKYLPPPGAPPDRSARSRSPSPLPDGYPAPTSVPRAPQYVKRSFLERCIGKKDYLEYPPGSYPGDGNMPPDAVVFKCKEGEPVRAIPPGQVELAHAMALRRAPVQTAASAAWGMYGATAGFGGRG